jgi:hypothetical protein
VNDQTEAVTDRFVRPAVDVDDTIPVALYTRPYDRLEIDVARGREIDARARRPPPTPISRGLIAAVSLVAFVSGFSLIVLLLG